MNRTRNIIIAIILILLGIMAISLGDIWVGSLFLSAGGIWGWRSWRSSSTSSSQGTQGSGGLSAWLVLILIFAIAGALLHHASREWIVENVTGVWQTQVAGVVYIPYEMNSLGTGMASRCLPQGVWKYKGVKGDSYQIRNSRGYWTLSFNGKGGVYPGNPHHGALLVSTDTNKDVLPGGVVSAIGGCKDVTVTPKVPPELKNGELILLKKGPIMLTFTQN